MIQQSQFWIYTPKHWKQAFEEMSVHLSLNSASHNSQWAAATQTCVDGWVDNTWCICYILWDIIQSQEEGSPVKCYTMDEPWGHDAKRNKAVTKRPLGMNLRTWSTRSNPIQRDKVEWWLPRTGAGGIVTSWPYGCSFASWESSGDLCDYSWHCWTIPLKWLR